MANYQTSQGRPVQEPYAAQRLTPTGPLLLQDFHLIDSLAHFDRERIPERVVHAKGAGAHGVFEVTDDISDICCSQIFEKVGTKCPASVRFSTVGGESGSADTARDPRGFSVKLKTEEGVWDHVYNNTPVFFIRDPAKFAHFIHTQKRNPQTNLKDADMFWDYISLNPESIHQIMILFGDRGVPDGFRFMNGYSGHTFLLINKKGETTYAQFHYISDQGIKWIDQAKAVELAGTNPDYATQDLFEAIKRGENPSWTLHVQTMTLKQAEGFKHSILDLTKVWPHSEYPLRRVGKLTLNKNPDNYFAEIEQIAFSPSHMVEGVEPSADPVLQSRLFSYPDTHRHRLGTNYGQLPVNAPLKCPMNFQRAGPAAYASQGAEPNYQATGSTLQFRKPRYTVVNPVTYTGQVVTDLSKISEADFEQPRKLWSKVFDKPAQERFVGNVAGHLGGAKNPEIKLRTVALFTTVDEGLGKALAEKVGVKWPVRPIFQ